MRVVLVVVLLVGAALAAAPAHAETEFAYCAIPGFGASQDCSFATLAQCQATTRGVGTDCMSNPRFKGTAVAPPSRPLRRSGTKS